MSEIIQAQYERLESIATRFDQRAASNAEMGNQMRQHVENLMNNGWVGLGADAFFNEMTDDVLPAIDRLTQALQQSQRVIHEIVRILQQAEEEAAAPFRGDHASGALGNGRVAAGANGGAGATSPGANGASPDGPSAGVAPTQDKAEGLTPEQELVRDQLKAVDTALKAAGVLGMIPGGERIKNLADSMGFKIAGNTISGVTAGMDAIERGVSPTAAVIDGAVVTALGLSDFGSSPVSAVVGLVHGVTSAISPEAGQYTAIAADAMPAQVAEKLAVGTIDTVDALARGDHEQLVRHHEQNLDGKYGEVIRGYAIGAEALGAVVTGDQQALNQMSDAAASGKLGKLAQFGDWLGGEVYDLFH